jgi:hypothetical protein
MSVCRVPSGSRDSAGGILHRSLRDRIARVVSQALEMARLDASDVELQLARHSVSELVDAAL